MGLLPRRRLANVGAGVSTKVLARTGRNLKDFFDRFLEPTDGRVARDAARRPAKSWSLKMGRGARRYTQVSIMVGDAGAWSTPSAARASATPESAGWPPHGPTRHARGDFSASTLSGYERQLRHQRAREHFSGHALVNLVPNLGMLDHCSRPAEKDPDARRSLVEGFTGDARSTASSSTRELWLPPSRRRRIGGPLLGTLLQRYLVHVEGGAEHRVGLVEKLR